MRSRRAPQPGPLVPALRICQPVRLSGARLAGQYGGVATARRAAGRGRQPSGAAAVGHTSAASCALRTAGKGATGSGTGWRVGRAEGRCYLNLVDPSSRDVRRHQTVWLGVRLPVRGPGHAGVPGAKLGLRVCGWRCPGLRQQPRPDHPSRP